jgi:tetratricopeptide (TPR) repeat protein
MKIRRTLLLTLFILLLAAGVRAQQSDQSIRRLSIPGQKWALEVSLPRFVVEQDRLRGDGKGRMILAGIEDEGYIVSIFLESIPHGETVTQLRDWAADGLKKSSSPKISDFKTSEYNRIPTLEYMIKEYKGQTVNQKHLNAYFVNGDYWVDVHFSKMLFKSGDEKLFYSILDTVKFTSTDSASMDSLGYVREGSAFFVRGDYKEAIEPYRKALELEKQSPQLSQTLWRVLVDNLGMSYGISGDFKSAKETFEYGLSKDPDYPMFHYLMACTYAETNDLDNTILYLKQAFARRQNIIVGEQMPDPATDDSFKRFMKNEKFRAALKELKQ